MKYLVPLFFLGLFSCGSKQVAMHTTDLDLPKPPQLQNAQSQRRLASDEEYLGASYNAFFGEQNYVGRLQKLRKLVRQLHFLMEEKGHPRKRLLKKFQDDLDKQIAFLERIETDQSGETKSWLPNAGTYQYGAKIRSLQAVKNSSDVMAQLEVYLAATQVMDDGTYEQNFYYNLMRKGLKALGEELQQRGVKTSDLWPAQLAYGDYLASSARSQMHKIFSDKKSRPLEKKLNTLFKQLQQVRTPVEAKNLVASPEVAYASSVLSGADYTSSADIEGFRDDIDTKLATYFGLEMIKYLYGRLN